MKAAKSKSVGLKIPNELCQKIMNCEYELDNGNITQ